MTSCDDVSYPSAYLEENNIPTDRTNNSEPKYAVCEGDQNSNIGLPTNDDEGYSTLLDSRCWPTHLEYRDNDRECKSRPTSFSGTDNVETCFDGLKSNGSSQPHIYSSNSMNNKCNNTVNGNEKHRNISVPDLEEHPTVSDSTADTCDDYNIGFNHLILLNENRDVDSRSLLVGVDVNQTIQYDEEEEDRIVEYLDNFDGTEYDFEFVERLSRSIELPALLKNDLVTLQKVLYDRHEANDDTILSDDEDDDDDEKERKIVETRNQAREAAFTAKLEQRGQHKSLYATYGDLSKLAIDSYENGTDDRREDELICQAHQRAVLRSNSSTIPSTHPSNSRALQSILLASNEINAYIGRRKNSPHAILTKSKSLDDALCDSTEIHVTPLISKQRGIILSDTSDDDDQGVDVEKGVDEVSTRSVSCEYSHEDIEAKMATVESEMGDAEDKANIVEHNTNAGNNDLEKDGTNVIERGDDDVTRGAEKQPGIECEDANVSRLDSNETSNGVEEINEDMADEKENKLHIDMKKQISNMEDLHNALTNRLADFADNTDVKENESFMTFLEELHAQLACFRLLINDLVDVNSSLEKKNVELMSELEESQDRFREGDVNDFREIQKELEQASRNCRIMQFKLRKAEKKLEEDGIPKSDNNDKNKGKMPDLADGDPNNDHIRDLNQQLLVAKDVSVRLHQELEMIEEKRTKLEEENQLYRKRMEDSDSVKQQLKRDLQKMRTEVEILRRKLKKEVGEETSDDIKKKIRRLTTSTTSEDDEAEYDMSRLINDLQNASEREKDLQNQLQLAEEEADSVRKSISALELDKEAIEFELERFKMRFGTLEEPKRLDNDRGVSTEREAEMRLQLMVAEQEATVMRKKILELETKNEEIGNGREQNRGRSEETIDTSTSNDSLKQEFEQLQKENSELQLKLTKWREFDKVFSPDKDCNVNENEDTIIAALRKELLFQKNHSIEIEVKNHVLQAEVQTLKKLSEIVSGGGGSKSKGKATENKLRAQIAVLRTEADNMRLQLGQLRVENERLTESEFDKSPITPDEDSDMKDAQTYPPEAGELLKLQENVSELEEQLDELQRIVRSKEMNEEKYEIEVQKVKEDMTKSKMVTSKEVDLQEKMRQLTLENEDLKQVVDLQKSQIAVNNAQIEQLNHPASSRSDSTGDDVFTDKTHSSEVKLNFERCLKERISHLEKQLQEERKRTRSGLDSKPDVVGETNDAVDHDEDRSPGGRDRERELLKFELNESSMLLEDMRKELDDERERRKLERAEFEKRLAEYFKPSFVSQAAEDKKRIERKYIFEKESVELQRKMEGFNWKKEKADLLKRIEAFKKKAMELEEKLNKHSDPKQSSDDLSKQMQDLQHVRRRLENQLATIDKECWKYKDQAASAATTIQKLTVENEELKAARDILKQERTVLHNKLSTLQVEHRETDIKIRKEREEWDIEKLQYLKHCNENNNAKQFKYNQELERLKKEKNNLEFQINEMEIKIEELEKKVLEREQRIASVQQTLKQMEDDWGAERKRINDNFEKELKLRAHETKIDLEEKELEIRCKVREIGELKEKLKDFDKDNAIQLKLIHDLERMQNEKEAKWAGERKELINQTHKTDAEKQNIQQAAVCDNSQVTSEGKTWESERSKLMADIKSLTSTLSNKEESWKAERVKYLSDIKDLRHKLRTIDDITEKRNTELCTKLEAANEMSESLKASESSFKDERQRLMKEIEQRDNLIEEANKKIETLRVNLESQREELNNTKIEILDRHQREEKLLRTEAAAHKFRLESETKLFREESKYLEDQMQYEIRQRCFYETTSLEAKREVGSIKSQLEVLKVDLAAAKADHEREALIAKRSKQLLEEIQREKREVHAQLTSETQRAEVIQKNYVDEKSGWDIMRNELQAKIQRLELQGKKKLKHEELEARLKMAWDKERIEHRRVISDLHNKTIELRRQVENSAVKWHRERAALQENFGRERKLLEDDRQRAESRISELLRKHTVVEESYQRTSEMEARLLQERDLWTVERYDLQKRLQENMTSRRLELSRIEALFSEMRRIRSGTGLESPTSNTDFSGTCPMSVHQDLITNGKIVSTNTSESKVRNSTSHARSKSVDRACSIGGAKRQYNMERSYDKALEQLEQVKMDLTSYEGQIRTEFAAKLKRARSQPDVLDSMVREQISPYKSSSLGRPSNRSSEGQRYTRSRSTERPVTDWVCKNECVPRRRQNRPVITSPGRFSVRGMLRETDRKSTSLPMDDPRYIADKMEEGFVETVRKALEHNHSPSRTTPPLGRNRNRSRCGGQYSDSEITTGGGGSDSDSEKRFTDPENSFSRPSRTLERPSRFGSGSGLLGQDIRKRSITSPQSFTPPTLSPMRSDSRLPSTPPSFLIPKKHSSIGWSSSGTVSPSQTGTCLIPGLLPKTKSQMQARDQERLNSPSTPTGNGYKVSFGRQSPRDDSRTSSPKSSQSSTHSSPLRVSSNVYTPQPKKHVTSNVTTRSETRTTITSQSKTSLTTQPNRSKTKPDVQLKPAQRRTVPIASEEGFDSGSEKSPAPMQTTESPLKPKIVPSKSATKSKLNVQMVPPLTSRFAKPQPTNRRPPSRWLQRRSCGDVCSDSEGSSGGVGPLRKRQSEKKKYKNIMSAYQYPVLNQDERALRLLYRQSHSCETEV
ncbi:uncharacterized protein [Antedon mediterranea]|uniref:uncharacterized protein isoform X3 n=1 Tax=Antedon mediterranea TaxID=105859 RepID=UPI003AF53876